MIEFGRYENPKMTVPGNSLLIYLRVVIPLMLWQFQTSITFKFFGIKNNIFFESSEQAKANCQ
jgi:hypothetical protein